MANREPVSHTDGMDHDLLAAFLGGEIQRKHPGALDDAALEFEADKEHEKQDNSRSDDTNPNPSCSNCCFDHVTKLEPCITQRPHCKTEADCHTHPPRCKTDKPYCPEKECSEPPKHASWLDKP